MQKFVPYFKHLYPVILFACSLSDADSQTLTEVLEKNANQKTYFLTEAEKYKTFSFKMQSGEEPGEIDPTEQLDIIVEFAEAPLFIQMKDKSRTRDQLAARQSRFDQFERDLGLLHEDMTRLLRPDLPRAKVKREFFKVFYGASLSVPRAALVSLRKLEYVKKVYQDEKVEAFLSESVPLIRADVVRDQFNTQGDSIIVAIIDTGIDYTHPALGGGFGLGFKVIGGHDFANNDTNPIDDNGHGTHVAGIVAADGDTLKGVAPKALLMAFKVLNSGGFGSQSDVLAGVERAMDPNNDNDMSDRVDIANLSLGGPGGPDNPLSTAVDNGVRLGTIFCVAAGNSGDFSTIGSPGTARQAITVGASSKDDVLAGFSSKGPNKTIQSIKPEIVAPGVAISSAALRSGTRELNGTSMATPHVAGVCALLKTIHPDWSPDIMKSAVMTSALDLGEEVMAQGSGRIDALGAAETQIHIVPAHLSFGLDDTSQETWLIADTLTVSNASTIDQDFSVSISGLQAGIALTADPANFSVTAGDSQEVVFTLAVANEQVPFPDQGSLAFSGTATVNSTDKSYRVPWAFVKASRLALTLDVPLFDFVLADEKAIFTQRDGAVSDDLTELVFVVPKGTYDFVAGFFEVDSGGVTRRFVIRENVVLDGALDLTVNSVEAEHQIAITGLDFQGNQFASLENGIRGIGIAFPNQSSGSVLAQLGSLNTFQDLRVSTLTERISLMFGDVIYVPGTDNVFHVIQYDQINGITSDVNLSNDPAQFVAQDLSASYPNAFNNRAVHAIGFLRTQSKTRTFSVGFRMRSFNLNSDEWRGKLFVMPDQSNGFGFSLSLEAAARLFEFDQTWFSTDQLRVFDGRVGSTFSYSISPAAYLSPDQGTMTFGVSPIYPRVLMGNDKTAITGLISFKGALNESRHSDQARAEYSLYDAENNLIPIEPEFGFFSLDVDESTYRLQVVNKNYFIAGGNGTGTLNAAFDLSQEDANPPRLTGLRIENSQNIATPNLEHAETATLLFSVIDQDLDNGTELFFLRDSSRAFYKEFGTDTWHELSVAPVLVDSMASEKTGHNRAGYLFSADLTEATKFDSAAIDLKIQTRDAAGNTTEWLLEPAFVVGNFVLVTGIDNPAGPAIGLPREFALYHNYPNPFNPSTTITFDLPRSENVQLRIFNLLGQVVNTLVDGPLKAGSHQINWDARDRSGISVASGIYFYRIEAGNFVATRKMLLMQ